MDTAWTRKGWFLTGLIALIVLGIVFVHQIFSARVADGIDTWVLELQQPIENRPEWNNGGGWTQYTSRYQGITFRYSLFNDRIEENENGISVTQMKEIDHSVLPRSVSLKSFENKYGLSPLNWWLTSQVLQQNWGFLMKTRWWTLSSVDSQSRLLVVGPSPLDGRQYVYTYLSCGEKICEIGMPLERDEYAETVYRRLLMTTAAWQPASLGFNPASWDQRYENTLAGYVLRYPAFDVDTKVRAPERDQDEAAPTDRIVRLPVQIGMTVSATFCSVPGSQGDHEDIETYLQDMPRSGFRERWSIKLPDSSWAQAVRVVGHDALAGLHTYQGSASELNERVVPDEAVYIKRGGLLLTITLDGLGRKDLFDAIVNEIELTPIPNLDERTGDAACMMQRLGWPDPVGSYWENKYVVMYLRDRELPSEDTRLVGVYPENFEDLGHGWGRQTANGWVLCRGRRTHMEYTSFRITDPEKGIAVNDQGSYRCSEAGYTE